MQALCESLLLNNLQSGFGSVRRVIPSSIRSRLNQPKTQSAEDFSVRNSLESPPYIDTDIDNHHNDQPLNLSLNHDASRSSVSNEFPSPTSSSDNQTSSNSDTAGPPKTLLQELLIQDRLDELINLKGLTNDPDEALSDPSQRLANIGDEIVEKLVDWARRLPIYKDLPVDIYIQLLTNKWAEIVLLSTIFYVCESHSNLDHTTDSNCFSFVDYKNNLVLLRQRLSDSMNRPMPLEYVEKGAGELVKTFTELVNSFKKLKLSQEAYVCLKVVTLLHEGTAIVYRCIASLTEASQCSNP